MEQSSRVGEWEEVEQWQKWEGRWEVIAASIPLAVDASEAMTTSVEVLVIFTRPTGSSLA